MKRNITSQHIRSYQPTKLKQILVSEKAAVGTLLQAAVVLIPGVVQGKQVVVPVPTAALVCMASYSSNA
jgi:hypothetical protein